MSGTQLSTLKFGKLKEVDSSTEFLRWLIIGLRYREERDQRASEIGDTRCAIIYGRECCIGGDERTT